MQRYHLYVTQDKWNEFIRNNDLRFFKYNKNLLKILKETHESGVMLKLCSWDYMSMKSSYILSNKFKHTNFIQYLCYFEYEENIIDYLCQSAQSDHLEENAVVIFPYYNNILKYDLNKNELYDCVKQIVLALYTAYFKYNILLTNVNINNIYLDKQNKITKIKYEIHKKTYTVGSQYIVKFDEYIHVKDVSNTSEDITDLYELYGSIISVLKQMEKDDLKEIIDFIEDFYVPDTRMIHPLKSVDKILSQAHVAQLAQSS